jgi:ERCC4-type nuclease
MRILILGRLKMNLKLFDFTPDEKKELLKSIVVLIDTREKAIKHITDCFDKKGVPWQEKKLEYGDYSFKIPECARLGIHRDFYFESEIIVERKAHLEELSTNLAQYRERFEKEWIRCGNAKKILLIEKGNLIDIFKGNYKSELNSAAYQASVFSFENRYDIRIVFCPREFAGHYIYYQFYYYLRERL